MTISLFCDFFSSGMKDLTPSNLNLKNLYQETVPHEPTLIIISPGADSSQELQELASEIIGAEHYHQVGETYNKKSIIFIKFFKTSIILTWNS